MTKKRDMSPEAQARSFEGLVIAIIGLIFYGFLRLLTIPQGIALVIMIIADVVMLVYVISSHVKDKKKLSNYFSRMPDFNPTKKYVDKEYETSGIAYDKYNKAIALVKRDVGEYKGKKYDYTDILSAEVFVDGNSITKTSRSSQIGRALLGGLTFGPIGAAIGGLSGKQKTEDTVSRVDLQVVVNDEENPRYIINFQSGEISKNLARNSINKARDWKSLIDTLIKKADEEDEK